MGEMTTLKRILFGFALVVIMGMIVVIALKQQEVAVAASEMAATTSEKPNFLNYDMVIGDKDAPIEIIEYAAISCPHCAHFHEEIFPELKEKYLDTGKARLVYRNFIFDNPFDVFAASITRCVSEDAFLPTLETYFNYQKIWNKLPDLQRIFETEGREAAMKFAHNEVAKIAKIAGLTDDETEQCFANEDVIDYLLLIRKEAVDTYGVNSTPTVIINGKKLEGSDMASLTEAIEAIGK